MTGPRHGYEILRFLETQMGNAWHVSPSQLYVLLKKLEQEGLLCSRMESQETRPPKRVFSLNSTGKKSFLDWLYSPTEHVRDLRIEFLAKLFFFRHFSLKDGSKLIMAQIQLLEKTKEMIKQRRESENDRFNHLIFGVKIATVVAWLEWLEKEAKPFIQDS